MATGNTFTITISGNCLMEVMICLLKQRTGQVMKGTAASITVIVDKTPPSPPFITSPAQNSFDTGPYLSGSDRITGKIINVFEGATLLGPQL